MTLEKINCNIHTDLERVSIKYRSTVRSLTRKGSTNNETIVLNIGDGEAYSYVSRTPTFGPGHVCWKRSHSVLVLVFCATHAHIVQLTP